MKRKLAKMAVTMAVAALAIGNTTTVASAQETQTLWCYADGSCDVDGICTNGEGCDGSHPWCNNNGGDSAYYDNGSNHDSSSNHDSGSNHNNSHHDSGSGHHGGSGHHSKHH